MMQTTGPPSRTRRRTTGTCTPAWSGSPTSLHLRRPGPVCGSVIMPSHVQRLHHHSARRLGYRRGCLVMMVAAHIDRPGVEPAPLGVQPFPPIGMIALSVNVPTAGNALSTRRNSCNALDKAFGFSTFVPSERRNGAHSNIHADGGPILYRRSLLPVLDAEAGEPRPRSSVDRYLADRPMEPQFFDHGAPYDLRQYHHLAVHANGVRSIIGAESLLAGA